ncbi:MAG: RNA methyltransferase [Bacteroidaceae bacterium]|nr:RNA methyltransferase [Bacteroidaceae bacterium]
MFSKARIKWIKSLEMRKYRLLHNAFVAEGPKLVGELLDACQVSPQDTPYSAPLYVAATKEWLTANCDTVRLFNCEIDEVSREELERVSLLRTPQSVLAVMPIPQSTFDFQLSFPDSNLFLALDGVQDPGNLGTILRIADWFGIHHVLCSKGTADVYNPKCVQSCMGALARVKVHYCNLPEVLGGVQMPVYGTFLDGSDIYEEELSQNGIIVMGNEGNGISAEVAKFVCHRLYVPNFPKGSQTTESLNVAVATGIVCAEFRRRGSILPPLR